MALIECPECRQSVSSSAMGCPHCGHPLAAPVSSPARLKHRRPWLLMGALFGIVTLILQGLNDLTRLLGWIDPENKSLETLAGIFALPALALLVYGLVSRYVLHRKMPVLQYARLRVVVLCLTGLFGLLIMATLSIPAFYAAARAANASIFSTDNQQLELRLPEGWEVYPGEAADTGHLRLWAPMQDAHLIVLSEPNPVAHPVSLHAYAAATQAFQKETFSQVSFGPPSTSKLGDRKCLTYEWQTTQDNIRIGMINLIVADQDRFWQLRLWTLDENYAKCREEFVQILASATFRK